MSDRSRPERFGRSRPLVLMLAATTTWGLLTVAATGCQSSSLRAFAGARHYAAGTKALDEGRTGPAIEELEEAARLVPQASEIQNHLGLAYWSQGRRERAEQAFEQALALDCENEPARRNLALLRRESSLLRESPRPAERSTAAGRQAGSSSDTDLPGVGGGRDGG